MLSAGLVGMVGRVLRSASRGTTLALALDLLSTASAAAYSLRKLRTAYAGNAVRVRRSSDNAETDIGFDPAGDLDTVALLAHVGSQNLLLHSEAFNNAVWVKTRCTISADVEVNPLDGTTTADKFVPENSSLSKLLLQNFNVVLGEVYTHSMYVKAGGYDFIQLTVSAGFYVTDDYVNFNLSAGSIGATNLASSRYGIESVGSGWYRIYLNAPALITGSARFLICALTSDVAVRAPSVTTNGVDGVLVWGGQCNVGATPQAYSATTTTARDGNGFVTTWYDQSGNASNLTQATAANQPRIVNAGVVNLVNGRPAITTTGGAIELANTAVPLDVPYAVNAVANRTGGTSYQRIISGQTDVRLLFGALNGNFISATGSSVSWNSIGSANAPLTAVGTTPRIMGVNVTATDASPFIDGTAMTVRTGPAANSTGIKLLTFGNQSWIGGISEITIFPAALSTGDRQTLEQNQGAFYGITVA